MNRNIQKLEELIPLLGKEGNCPVIVYELEDGRECPVWGLFSIDEKVAVVQAHMPSGSVFPQHSHRELEVLVPYEGEMEYTVNGKVGRVGPGTAVAIPPNAPHHVQALSDCWMIAITVPDSEGYPHAAG